MPDAILGPAPCEDEKTMALLAHILQIFTWWIGPLVIYLVKRESRFVRFHAMQALIWQIVLSVLMMFGAILWILLILAIVLPHAGETGSHQTPPLGLFLVVPIFWLAMMAVSILNVVLGIVYAVRASRGQWSQYPLIGRWASSIVGS